jgi:hypothetical protein
VEPGFTETGANFHGLKPKDFLQGLFSRQRPIVLTRILTLLAPLSKGRWWLLTMLGCHEQFIDRDVSSGSEPVQSFNGRIFNPALDSPHVRAIDTSVHRQCFLR